MVTPLKLSKRELVLIKRKNLSIYSNRKTRGRKRNVEIDSKKLFSTRQSKKRERGELLSKLMIKSKLKKKGWQWLLSKVFQLIYLRTLKC
jgi:hypothetical protein